MEKMLRNEITYFKKIYKVFFDYFFIGVIYFLSFIKNIFIKIICKFSPDYFFIGATFLLLSIKNLFITIKNSIFPQKYTRHEKKVESPNCSFQKSITWFLTIFVYDLYLLFINEIYY